MTELVLVPDHELERLAAERGPTSVEAGDRTHDDRSARTLACLKALTR